MRHKGPRLCLQEDAGNRSSGYAMDPQGTISNVAYGNALTMYSATSRLARRSLPTTLGNLPGKLGNVPKPKNLGNVQKKYRKQNVFAFSGKVSNVPKKFGNLPKSQATEK